MTKYFFIYFISLFCLSALAQRSQAPKNYEVVKMIEKTVIRKDGSSLKQVETLYKVLTETGRSELSLQKIPFQSSDQTFKLVGAYATNSGKIVRVMPKDVRIEKVSTKDFAFTDLTEAIIPFQNVGIGGEIHLRYELEQKPYIGNVFAMGMAISNSVLGKEEHYSFTSDTPLQIIRDDFTDYFVAEETRINNKFILIVKPTRKAYHFEGIRVQVGKIFLTSANNWKQLRESEAPAYKAAWNAPLPEKLNPILAQAKTKKSKKEVIEYIAQEINKLIAYSGDWSTKHGKMRPASIANTLTSGKGDCKDYSTLMTALLRKLDFEAYPFLTFRSAAYMGEERLKDMARAPNPAYFNHVIVWAKDAEGKTWWVDPTNPYVQADVITSDILGNFGLLLDDKSVAVTFLPTENSKPASWVMENTFTLGADNSVSGKGSVSLESSSYNLIKMAERMRGPEIVKKIFSYMIAPISKTITIDFQKTPTDKLAYEYTLHTSDLVDEKIGKYKAIKIFNSLGLYLDRIGTERDADLGEIGTTKVTTLIKGQKIIDVVDGGCLIRSKWIDADRYVENKPEGLLVTDIIKNKVRFISKQESKGEAFESVLRNIYDCGTSFALTLHLDDSLKTAEYKEQEKLKGPDLDAMTEEEATRLYKMSGPELFSYRNLKVFRYYEKKLAQNPKDTTTLLRMANTVAMLGYLSGDTYVPGHLEDALKYLKQGLANPNESYDPKIAEQAIKYLTLLDLDTEAVAVFTKLNQMHPKNLYGYLAGYYIAEKQKKYDVAEKWLRASQPLCKTSDEIDIFHSLMTELLRSQKKYREAIPHQEHATFKDPKDAWGWHNLAILYYQLDDYDKTIELEKKALAISEFGIAKKMISDSYIKKAKALQLSTDSKREPASFSIIEQHLQEAIKYDSRNIVAHINLARKYSKLAGETRDKSMMSKAKSHLERATEIDPTSPDLAREIENYKILEKVLGS